MMYFTFTWPVMNIHKVGASKVSRIVPVQHLFAFQNKAEHNRNNCSIATNYKKMAYLHIDALRDDPYPTCLVVEYYLNRALRLGPCLCSG